MVFCNTCSFLIKNYTKVMKIHWLVKYYFIAFLCIFLLVYNIENSEPYVKWSLYSKISETTGILNSCDFEGQGLCAPLGTTFRVGKRRPCARA